jgi:hypothetical protein
MKSDRVNVCLRGTVFVTVFFVASCVAPSESDERVGESSQAQTDPNDPSWDCYAPEPGHPTASEKTAFFTRRVAAAQEAERTYGVPAAAILAMAAQEGGYGFTRIALLAKNEFGYKFTSSSAAGGRGSYTLGCQPAFDVGNKYIVFSDARDGILFIAFKLATRADYANYKAATDAYRAARASGADVTTSVNKWIDGIANEGYNYDPPTYKATIKAMATRHSLYQYSASLTTTSGSWVAIDSPAANANVTGDVPLQASASSGVTRITFTSITSSGSEYQIGSVGAPFDLNWATTGNVPAGAYSIRFDAYAGATKVASATRRVTVY